MIKNKQLLKLVLTTATLACLCTACSGSNNQSETGNNTQVIESEQLEQNTEQIDGVEQSDSSEQAGQVEQNTEQVEQSGQVGSNPVLNEEAGNGLEIIKGNEVTLIHGHLYGGVAEANSNDKAFMIVKDLQDELGINDIDEFIYRESKVSKQFNGMDTFNFILKEVVDVDCVPSRMIKVYMPNEMEYIVAYIDNSSNETFGFLAREGEVIEKVKSTNIESDYILSDYENTPYVDPVYLVKEETADNGLLVHALNAFNLDSTCMEFKLDGDNLVVVE